MPPQIFRPSYNYNMECTSSLSSSSKIDDFPLSLVLYFQCRPYCSYQRELIDDLGNRLLQSNSGASLLYHQTRVCERLSYNESKIVYICRFVPQILFFFVFFAKRQGIFTKHLAILTLICLKDGQLFTTHFFTHSTSDRLKHLDLATGNWVRCLLGSTILILILRASKQSLKNFRNRYFKIQRQFSCWCKLNH